MLLSVLGCLLLGAQEDYRKTFEDFTRQARQYHSAFTDTVNLAFARAIEKGWEKFYLSDGNRRQEHPEPETLPVAEEGQRQFELVPVLEIVDTVLTRWSTETDLALWKQKESPGKTVRFDFYETPMLVPVPEEYGSFHPKGITETDVGAFWRELSRYDYGLVLAECTKCVEQYGYNDWAVLEWVQSLSAEIYPGNTNSEQTIFAVFLLNQMGLMTKLARADDRLVSLFSSMQPVFARKFVTIDSYPFYLAGNDFPASEVFTYRASFMKPSRPLDLCMYVPPTLGTPNSFTTVQKHSSLFNASFDLPINQALMRFYGHYPQTSAQVYALARPETRFSSALVNGIGNRVQGLPEVEAVNKLLAFVQTEFRYMTDVAQFGYEKPFFCEENFVYEYNDCEDRAVLFAYLVKTLTGCDVVLLEYPDHLAAAVQMDADTKGDHIRIKENNYYVCDPSYIGATVGMTIAKYKKQAVKVYVL